MPRFYVDLDEVGTEAADPEAVRQAAHRFLPEILKDDPRPDLRRRKIGLLVRDQGGRTVHRASLVLRGDDEDLEALEPSVAPAPGTER